MSSSASCPNMVAICQAKQSVPSTSTALSEMDNSPSKLKGHERKTSSEDGIHYVDDDDGVEFALDAKHLNRVHEELEKLNIATDVINKLELQIDEAKVTFRMIHNKWTQKLDELNKKYGSAIQKSKPYYDAIQEERKLKEQAQEAAVQFERANSMLQVAKQQVKLTQDSLERQKNIEPECLEVLNHHIQRVTEADKERIVAEAKHREIFEQMVKITQQVKQLEKENGRSIKKSKHYYEQIMEYKQKLGAQKALINRLEKEVKQKKCDYTNSLKTLEQISDSIHEERSLTSIKQRGSGGASPDIDRKDGSNPGSTLKYSASNVTTNSDYATSSSVDESEMTEEKRTSMIADFYQHSPNGFDPVMFDDELESLDEISSSDSKSRPNSLNGGVILLAQQLLNGGSKHHKEEGDKDFCFPLDSTDVRYHTMPEGICPLPSSSEYCSDSDLSSLASARDPNPSTTNDKTAHEPVFQRSVSDVDNNKIRL